ncbi:unnamed protein product [Knipowitschia caucasica]|uniref:Uncharacterized protein n=1 Tax=Knipowitschia caucasica TaxID=637954 RepID=A0AAV2K803_KNICA
MATLPVVLLLCAFHVFTAGAQTESTEAPESLPSDCREEMYPCTRMYSVHRPAKKCIGGFCLYSGTVPRALRVAETHPALS